MSDLQRSQPFSEEAEKTVLACLLWRAELIDDAMERGLGPAFYHPAHRHVFEAIVALRSAAKPVDAVALMQYLLDRQTIDKAGGPHAVAELSQFPPTQAHYPYFVAIMEDKALLRGIISASTENIQNAYDVEHSAEPLKLLDAIESRMLAIRPKDRTKPDLMRHYIDGTLREIMERMETGSEMSGIPTGFGWLDNMVHGLRPEAWYIGARPSVGKTTFILQIIEEVAIKRGIPVGFFSLEMSREAINKRLLSLATSIPLNRLFGGTINKEEQRALNDGAKKLKKAEIYCDDRSGMNHSTLRAKARRWKRDHGVALICVDFLQRMAEPPNARKNSNGSELHRENSKACVDGVKELEIPWLICAQLNRDCEKNNRHPRLSDFEWCGGIEQDADVALLLSKPARQPNDAGLWSVRFDLAKQRNGPTEAKNHLFRKQACRFDPWPSDDQEEDPQPTQDKSKTKARKDHDS